MQVIEIKYCVGVRLKAFLVNKLLIQAVERLVAKDEKLFCDPFN